ILADGSGGFPWPAWNFEQKEHGHMAPITIGFGFFLAVVGLVGWVATGSSHVTALIPAFFGVALAFLGVLARRDLYRKHVMHVAVLIGLIGFLFPAGRLLMLSIHPPENAPS